MSSPSTQQPPQRIFNVVPSFHDERDFFIVVNHDHSEHLDNESSKSLLLSTSSVPTERPLQCDLRPLFPTVYNQGNIGSCTAMAVCSVVQYNARSQTIPSRLFNYYCSRGVDNNTMRDVGATIKDATQVLFQLGVCRESLWPYNTTLFSRQPPHTAYTDASQQRIDSYARVTISQDGLEHVLQAGFPVCIGILVYSSFTSATTQRTGVVTHPNTRTETLLGGHAVVIVGYNRTNPQNPVFLVRNSWGAQWGDKGYCTIPYSYILDRSLAFDAWIIMSGQQKSAPQLRVINPRQL